MCLMDETKACTDCGECDRCDLDPNKLCDNCCHCLQMGDAAYARIPVQDIVTEQVDSYMQEMFDEEEEAAELPAYELDPALLAEWEQKLAAFEEEHKQLPPQVHGSRKRERRP